MQARYQAALRPENARGSTPFPAICQYFLYAQEYLCIIRWLSKPGTLMINPLYYLETLVINRQTTLSQNPEDRF